MRLIELQCIAGVVAQIRRQRALQVIFRQIQLLNNVNKRPSAGRLSPLQNGNVLIKWKKDDKKDKKVHFQLAKEFEIVNISSYCVVVNISCESTLPKQSTKKEGGKGRKKHTQSTGGKKLERTN